MRNAWPVLLLVPGAFLWGCPSEVSGPDQPPVARAGPDRDVEVGEPVDLDGSASNDPEGAELTFEWELVTRPAGGENDIENAQAEGATLTPDWPGVWVVRLVVSDGRRASRPDLLFLRAVGLPPCRTDADCPDDGRWCSGEVRCEEGECLEDPPDCSDGNVCTQDVCNEDLNRCENPPVVAPPGTEGPVGDPTCTDGEDNDCDTLVDGDDPACKICSGDPECDDLNPCTRDHCVSERCENASADDGSPCYDGQWCTVNDTCTGGVCGGDPQDCSGVENDCNGSACDDLADACAAVPFPAGTGCNDGLACTVNDACNDLGECQGTDKTIVPVGDGGCDDANVCTYDGCDPGNGQCSYIPNTEPCDDGMGCTEPDVCDGAGACRGVENSALCPAGQICSTACFAGDGGCGSPPASLALSCGPEPVDLFSGEVPGCTLTGIEAGQGGCLACSVELGIRTLDFTDFTGCDPQGWRMVVGNQCSDAVSGCVLGGSTTRTCCGRFETVCVQVGSEFYLRTDERQNCGGGREQWRIEKSIDFRGSWRNRVCFDVADVNANTNQGILVFALDKTHPQELVFCLNGEPRSGVENVFYRACASLPDWTHDNQQVILRFVMHSENEDRAMLVDNIAVQGWALGCTPGYESLLAEDFGGCDSPLVDGWNDWTVEDVILCQSGFDCYDASERAQVAGGSAALSRALNLWDLDGDAELCFHHGDDGVDLQEHFQVEIDPGGGWSTVWDLLGDPGADGTCGPVCVNLSDQDPAIHRNASVRLKFSLTSNVDEMDLDHIAVTGARFCDGSDRILIADPTDEGDGRYTFTAENTSGVPTVAEMVCRWSALPGTGLAAATRVTYADPFPGWNRRRRLDFDNTGQAEDLTDFPVAVLLDVAWFDYGNTHGPGADLRFVDADLQTVLPHEIEKWDVAGASVIWVRVPHIPGGSADDHIWMYYDNDTAASGEAPAGVWDRFFRGVWHLAESLGSTAIDSTGQVNGTYYGSPQLGQDGGLGDWAVSFDGNDDYVFLGDMQIVGALGNNGITLEVFAGPQGVDRQERLVSKADGQQEQDHWWMLSLDSNGSRLRFRLKLDDTTRSLTAGSGNVVNGSWFYGVATYDGTGMRLYFNGDEAGSNSETGAVSTGAGRQAWIGANPTDRYEPWDGLIGEVRISDIGRSADWVRAQYLSLTGAFVSFSMAETR